jgi:oligosaccharide repeat unit polymerase
VLIFACALFAVTFFVAARMFAPREGYYSTVVVFGLGCLLYYLGIPIEMTLTGSDKLYTEQFGILPMGPELQGKIALLGALAFASFVVGYRLSGFRPVPAGTISGAVPEPWLARVPVSAMLFALGSVLMLLVLYRNELVAVGLSYKSSVITVYESAGFAALQKYSAVALALVSATLLATGRKRYLLAAILSGPAIYWGVYSSNKNPMLVAVLGFASVIYGRRSRRAIPFFTLMAVAVFAGFLWIIVFSQYRGGLNLDLSRAFARRSFVRGADPAGPMISLIYYLSEPSEYLFGTTYLLTNILWIPKVVWPSRPLDLSEAFAREHLSHWIPGQGVGYSLLTEAYRNFGWFGPVMQYMAIGLIWGLMWRLIAHWFQRVSPAYWRAVYATYGYYMLLIMHRGPTSFITTAMMQLFVPLLALSLFFDRRQVSSKAQRRPQPSLGRMDAGRVGA